MSASRPSSSRSDGRRRRADAARGVVTAALLVEGEDVRLVAVWSDRETLDRLTCDTGATSRAERS